MGDAKEFETRFLSQVGLEKNDSLFYEMQASLTTGVQVRFVSFLQAILTVMVGEDIVNKSSDGGFMDDVLASEKLDELKMAVNSKPLPVGCDVKLDGMDSSMKWLLANERAALLDGKLKNKLRKHSLLLALLRRTGDNFSRLKDLKTNETNKTDICKDIRGCLQVVQQLLQDAEDEANQERKRQAEYYSSLPHHKLKTNDGIIPIHFSLQRSLLFGTVLADAKYSYTKIEKFEIIKKVSQYNTEQLIVIERLIPRLNIMVVSEIIASFNWTMAQLLKAIYNLHMFEQTFTDSAKCATFHRNWVSHNFPIGDGNHSQFTEDANWVVDKFLKPRLQGSETDDSKKKGAARKKRYLSYIFPGLDEYFEITSSNLLDSCNELNKMREENKKLKNDLTAERDEHHKTRRQLDAKVEELDAEKKRVAELTKEASLTDSENELPQPASVPSTNKPVKSLAEGQEMLQNVAGKPRGNTI